MYRMTTSQPQRHFDPSEPMPDQLRARLDRWFTNPPRRQFQAYGPLNAYLQGHKFPTDKFIVKPQKLLRKMKYCEWAHLILDSFSFKWHHCACRRAAYEYNWYLFMDSTLVPFLSETVRDVSCKPTFRLDGCILTVTIDSYAMSKVPSKGFSAEWNSIFLQSIRIKI